MVVGVDIDDMVFFFSLGFWCGKKIFLLESEDYLKNFVFWEKMNNGWDEFSILKEVVCQLIDMYVCCGDVIFFVIGCSLMKIEMVLKMLVDNFYIFVINMNLVIFVGDKLG